MDWEHHLARLDRFRWVRNVNRKLRKTSPLSRSPFSLMHFFSKSLSYFIHFNTSLQTFDTRARLCRQMLEKETVYAVRLLLPLLRRKRSKRRWRRRKCVFFISSFFDPPVRPGSSSVCQPLGAARWDATSGRMCTQWDPRWPRPLMFLLTLRVFFIFFFD